MSISKCFAITALLALAALGGGCAKDARSTEGFAITDSITVDAPFQEAWQTTKAVLREKEYDIYTRDKRGVFVAFSKMKRTLGLVPHRVKYTVSLKSVSDESTEITVESIRQVYGVTLLTYPGWHDRKTEDHDGAVTILQAVQAKVGGEVEAASASS